MGLDGHRGGVTFNPDEDEDRLNRQAIKVFAAMDDGAWHTLAELEATTGHPQASISARLRDLRKARFGGHLVERHYHCKGVWCYRLTVNDNHEETTE